MRHIMILAAAVVLTACGGGGSAVDTSSAAAIAKALNAGGFTCTGFTPNHEVLMARTDGTCEHGSTTVSITTFNSRDQQAQVGKAFAAFSSGVPVTGDAWSVSVDSRSQARQVSRIIGGSVQK
jgi:ABC-type glycerol-3-phosphate transport system substrate-binding protein